MLCNGRISLQNNVGFILGHSQTIKTSWDLLPGGRKDDRGGGLTVHKIKKALTWMGQCKRKRGISDKDKETVCMTLCVQECMCSVERSEPNLTADLARASGARESPASHKLSFSVSVSHTPLLKVSHCVNTSFQNMCYWPGKQGK